MNRNFSDMLAALSEENAEFLVVGAVALSLHGFPRFTGDLDIWVNPTPENAERVWRALQRFRAPLLNLKIEDLHHSDIVFQIGAYPQRIDLLTSITGVEFDAAWPNRVFFSPGDGLPQAPTIGLHDLIQNKKATGRPKDQIDALWLESKET